MARTTKLITNEEAERIEAFYIEKERRAALDKLFKAQALCRHKFINTKYCVRCGWRP